MQPPRPARADVKPPMPSTEQLRMKKLPRPPGKADEKAEEALGEDLEEAEEAKAEEREVELEEGHSAEDCLSTADEGDILPPDESAAEEKERVEVQRLSLDLEDVASDACDVELTVSAAETGSPVAELPAGIQHLLQFAPPPDHPAPPPPKWRAKAGLSPRGDKDAGEELSDKGESERSSDALLSPRYNRKPPEVPQRKKSTPGPGRPPRSPPTWQRPTSRPLVVGSQRKVSSSS